MESLIGKLNHAAHAIPPARYLLNQLCHLLKRGGKWGPQRLQLWHRQDLQMWMKFLQHVTTKGVPNQQHSLCQTISNAMVWRLWIWNRGVQWKWPRMELENTLCMAWETHVEPPIIPSVRSDHLHEHPSIGTGFTHPGIKWQFKHAGMDAQSNIWSIERRISQCSSTLAWMDTRQSRDIPICWKSRGPVSTYEPITEYPSVIPSTRRTSRIIGIPMGPVKPEALTGRQARAPVYVIYYTYYLSANHAACEPIFYNSPWDNT